MQYEHIEVSVRNPDGLEVHVTIQVSDPVGAADFVAQELQALILNYMLDQVENEEPTE